MLSRTMIVWLPESHNQKWLRTTGNAIAALIYESECHVTLMKRREIGDSPARRDGGHRPLTRHALAAPIMMAALGEEMASCVT